VKITAYYNIYKTDSPRSYNLTKTCVVLFLIKQLMYFQSLLNLAFKALPFSGTLLVGLTFLFNLYKSFFFLN